MGISHTKICIHPLLEIQDGYNYTPRAVEIDDTVYDSKHFPELSLLLLIAAKKCYDHSKIVELLKSIFISNKLYERIIEKISKSDLHKIKINSISYFDLLGDDYLLSSYIQKKQWWVTVFYLLIKRKKIL